MPLIDNFTKHLPPCEGCGKNAVLIEGVNMLFNVTVQVEAEDSFGVLKVLEPLKYIEGIKVGNIQALPTSSPGQVRTNATDAAGKTVTLPAGAQIIGATRSA